MLSDHPSHDFDTTVEATSTSSTFRLTDLPVELLIEILKQARWRDILHLRATCTLLSDVTREREVWAHHVREHIAGIRFHPPRLERPIETYLSGDLERILLLWESAELGWLPKGHSPARQRSVMVEPAEYVHLIQGGRWLLVTTNACEVTYYDLNAENIEDALLIPQQIHKPLLVDHKMSIDIDMSAPTLSFRIAFSIIDNSATRTEPSDRKATIQIWGITLLYNGLYAIGLGARRLALLHHHSEISTVLQLSLLGPTIAFNALFFEGNTYTVVFNWDKAEENSTTYSRRVVRPPSNIEKLQLLRGNKLFMANGSCLYLFDYSMVKETSPSLRSLPNSPADCIWQANLDSLFARDISDCVFNTSSAHFFMTASCRIHSLVIEDALISNTPPRLITMKRAHQSYVFPRYTYCRQTCLGYSRALAIDRYRHVLWIKHYSRNIKSKNTLIDLPPACRAPIMDEESGRVVVPGFTGSQKMTVIDFALVFKKAVRH